MTKESFKFKVVQKMYCLGLASIALVAIMAVSLYTPAQASQGSFANDGYTSLDVLTCSPPSDWNQTTRLKNPQNPTKEWTFSVDSDEMDVRLIFFYYQDYDKAGCPYICGTGECQTDETGKGTTPLGNFAILDGKLGANRGVKQLEGRLSQGTYKVTFTAKGDPGSLNVGLQVNQESPPAPTNTPEPTAIIPTATATATLTPTQPEPSPSPTKPGLPKKSPTPTTPKQTPPATLPPPTPFPGSATPMILIPETGAGLEAQQRGSDFNGWVLVPLGVGLLGTGMVFFAVTMRLKKR